MENVINSLQVSAGSNIKLTTDIARKVDLAVSHMNTVQSIDHKDVLKFLTDLV